MQPIDKRPVEELKQVACAVGVADGVHTGLQCRRNFGGVQLVPQPSQVCAVSGRVPTRIQQHLNDIVPGCVYR